MIQRLHSIDHLRVYAALTVLFGHAVHVLHESETFQGQQSGFYRQGVGAVVFLAIASLIALYTERERFGEPGACTRYLRRRLARIVPLYWFFTTLFVLLAALLPSLLDHHELALDHTLGSYCFWPVARPGDGRLRPLLNPGWVLNYIVWFHVLFALCLTLRRRQGLSLLIAVLLCAFAVGQLLTLAHAAWFFTARYVLVLVLGIVCLWIHDLANGRFELPIPVSVAAVGSLFVLSWNWGSEEGDYPSIVCAFGIVVVASFTRGFRTKTWFSVAWGTLAQASYSIYLSQAFTLAGFVVIAEKLSLLAYLPYWAAVAATMAFALVAGVLTHRYVERPLSDLAARRVGEGRGGQRAG